MFPVTFPLNSVAVTTPTTFAFVVCNCVIVDSLLVISPVIFPLNVVAVITPVSYTHLTLPTTPYV